MYSWNSHEKVQPIGEPYSKPYFDNEGNKPGGYDNWCDTHAQVTGYYGARFGNASTFGETGAKFQ